MLYLMAEKPTITDNELKPESSVIQSSEVTEMHLFILYENLAQMI